MKSINISLAGKKVVEKWRYWVSLPFVIILAACIAFGIYAGIAKDASRGINLGIDFTGGNIVTVQTKYDANDNEGYKATMDIIKEVLNEKNAVISYDQKGGGGSEKLSVIVRFGLLAKDNQANTEANDAIVKELQTRLSDKVATPATDVSLEYIGPSASKELIWTAVLSVLISSLLILLYIVIRFRNIFTGLSAIIALLHDVIIVFAMTIICHIQINSSFIAAIITIISYSINNTIVLFDRVRENMKNVKTGEAVNNNMIVNKSIAQTLSRSILTTITTMASIVVLAIIGVSSIREFALPVIFGLLAGTFSSVFLAPSLFCLMKNASDKADRNRAVKPKKVKKNKKALDATIVEE